MSSLRLHAKFLLIILVTFTVLFGIASTVLVRREAWLPGLFFGALIVIGAAVTFAVRRMVLRPLRSLQRGAEAIAQGDLGHRVPVEGRDEFAELAGSFNEMASRLQDTVESLENGVRTRTIEMNENVRLLQGILSSMPSGVVLLTRDGLVKLMNRQGMHILRRDTEDLAGRRLTEIVPEAQAFLHARSGAREEIVAQLSDGNAVPIGFVCSSYATGEGDQEDRIVVFQDLTELKSLQAEFLDKERFAAIGRVVASVAHEIRNPLFGISAIGQVFERDLKDPAFRDLARTLLVEAKRLNLLVEDLLLYGRTMKLKLEQADLRVLWEEVLDLHREELKRRRIKVTGDYAVRHPVATFDPHQIRQVFLNLLRNAMEATPDGGSITITMLLEDRYILFRVSDTGIGISKDRLPHVLELFYTTKTGGTGLGLAICRKILEDHGGDILIASQEGRGTTVTVKLPYEAPAGE